MSEQPVTESRSIEERVLDHFAGPDQPEGPQEQQAAEASTEPEFEEVEFEGERYQIPPKLKEGLMRQADYTRKTTETAKQREALEIAHKQIRAAQEAERFRETVKGDIEQLAMIDAYLKQPVDWANLSTDDMLRRRGEIDQLKERRHELVASIDARQQEFGSKIKGEIESAKKARRDHLSKVIPGFTEATEKELIDYAESSGIPRDLVDATLDPSQWLILSKARQYDKLVSEKDSAAKRAQSAPVGKPGSARPMPSDVKDKLNFRHQLAKAKPGTSERRHLVEGRVAKIFS